ncbi:stage VI sporulation protein D [Alteribacillus bidgolensis]|uniref:Stage VI sporulation protein D n=1 Tax=Alteribacillus bidgolensis TaxID=930129 RepID=A0A1G8QKR3_9BACI|nr:stage VI sporulation protein D [Alteribacillus bidgolensis]SDJ05332.1 stage VI sporulation protein D [Alteribacillus bidgolensis]
MGAERSSALTFNLEESVWLDKGQKMKELLSLGLEPDIRIEEKMDYVAIKGGLHLKGEYRPLEEERNEEPTDDNPSPQYVEEDDQRDDGIGEIKHFFPVDVTIPLNRIHNLDDIYVQIDGFDYDLPEPDCIQLTADVSITGMKNEETAREEEQSEPLTAPEPMPRWDIEAKYQPEEAAPPDFPRPYDRTFSSYFQTSHENVTEETEEEAFNEGEGLKSDEEKENEEFSTETEEEIIEDRNNEISDNEQEDNEQEEDQIDNQSVEAKEQQESSSPIVTSFHSRDETESENVQTIEPSAEDIEEVDTVQTEQEDSSEEESTSPSMSDRDDNALYLTKVMTKGEEEFSRVKMCIIQENESLDTIAERYDITISHLVRYNRLDNEHLEEGQILYIPASAAGSNKNEG